MVEKFEFWCQKVLPTIYDDSLSYYDAICKMATYLNATIDQVNEFQKMIDALPETILNSEEFQKMVQDAVDGKIDALYKVVQDALDEFDKEIDTKFTDMKSELDADQAAFEKQVNASNTAFQEKVDGQVSQQNTNIENFKTEVNGKLTGYETSDAQFKQEVNTKLSGYESDNAQFKSQVNTEIEEIKQAPKYPLCQNSNGAVTQEFDVAMTYYHNDNLIYGNYHTPFNTSAAAQSGKYEIDCSSFVQLCLMGVPYENTRWFNDENAQVSGYYFGDDLIIDTEADRPYGMLSDDMCKWFVEHGYYFETSDPSQLKPGDVVFMTFNTESPTYKHVTHCGLFVSYQAITDEIWCISAGNTSDARPKVVSRESYSRTSASFVGFGRLPLPDCEFNATNLLAEKQSQIQEVSVNLSSTKHVMDAGRIRMPNSLKKNKVYTLVAKIQEAQLPLYFTLQSGNTSLTNISIANGEWIYVPFVLNFVNTSEIETNPKDSGTGLYLLSVYARTLSSETSTVTRTVIFENLALYEGVVISPVGAVPENPPSTTLQYHLTRAGTFNTVCNINEEASITEALDQLVSEGIAKVLSIAAINVATSTTTLPAGQYLVFTYPSTLNLTGNVAFGAQYIVGASNGAIYGRFANKSTWGAVTKIAPAT